MLPPQARNVRPSSSQSSPGDDSPNAAAMPDKLDRVGRQLAFLPKQERIGSAPNLLTLAGLGEADTSSMISSSTDGSETEEAGALLNSLSMNGSPTRQETRLVPLVSQCSSSGCHHADPSVAIPSLPQYWAGAGRHTPVRNPLGNIDSNDGAKAKNPLREHLADSGGFELGVRPSGDVFLSGPETSLAGQGRRGFVADVPHPTGQLSSGSLSSTVMMVPPRTLRTRSSNIGGRHHVGGVDAQGVYPPTACVFVANLPEPKDDRSLEAAVTREFSKFGTVFVKIRRDGHHMPFAFCQYTKDEDAKAAMEQGKGTIILGRACRTEMVKANRAFYIHRRRGEAITLDEARSALSPFGSLSKVEFLSASFQEAMGIPPSAVVEFTVFDPSRDLQSAFRHNDRYRVDVFDPKRSLQPRRNDPDEAFLNQYEVDRRSVFVGGLPADIDESIVKALFSRVGNVVNLQLIKKATVSGIRVFAFVEFDRPDTPEAAMEALHDYALGECKIRVERKVVRDHTTPRRVRSQYHLSPLKSPGDNTQCGDVSLKPATPNRGAVDVGQVERLEQAEEAGQLEQLEQQAGRGTSVLLPATTSATQTPTQAVNQAWNWMYPAQSPTQAAFGGHGYVAAPPSPYGTQIANGAVPLTPQGTPGAYSPYAAYYPTFWPGMSFMQDPMGTAAAYYASLASPTTTMYADGQGGHIRDEMLGTPTRTNNVDGGSPDKPGCSRVQGSQDN